MVLTRRLTDKSRASRQVCSSTETHLMDGTLLSLPCMSGTLEDVPIFQRMPFVVSGYRLNHFHWTACIASVLKLHNETCNIWTHLIGFIYFVVYGFHFVGRKILDFTPNAVPSPVKNFYLSYIWEDTAFLIILGLIISSAWSMLTSTTYHIFSSACHSSHKAYLNLDISGIGILISWSFLAGVYIGFACRPVFQIVYTAQTTILACLLVPLPFFSSLWPKLETYFPVFFSLLSCTGIVPLAHFLCIVSTPSHQIFATYLVIGTFLYLSGLFFYFSKFPEKYFPGKFDLFGHSHQLWHIFVFFASSCWVHGCVSMYRAFQC